MNQQDDACPCGSGLNLQQCCLPVIQSDRANSAEQLMRSRYTAFVLADEQYLLKTWHSSTRPEDFALGKASWLGLQVLESTSDTVSFEAAFHLGSKGMLLQEKSRFTLEEGHWRYIDGDCVVSPIQRNAPCFCGSGIKFKRCCGLKG